MENNKTVEVLRKEIFERNGNIAMLAGNIDVKDLNELKLIRDSMNEALFALEKLDRLEKWLDKEIEGKDKNENSIRHRRKILKEVREVLE